MAEQTAPSTPLRLTCAAEAASASKPTGEPELGAVAFGVIGQPVKLAPDGG